MSEVQSRPAAPRGRGPSRGGRGGFTSRGGRGGRGHATNGDKPDSLLAPSIEDEGEVGQLKKKYGSKISTISEMFPGWTDEDIVFALQETDGDLSTAVERMSDGTISQWGEVSKNKKDRSRSKVKDATIAPFSDATNLNRPSRGGRAGFDSGRGGRGRGADRGRGGRGGRGASVAHTNGSRNKDITTTTTTTTESWDTPAVETTAWDTTKSTEPSEWDTAKPADTTTDSSKPAQDTWSATATGTAATVATTAANATSSIIPDGVKKSWASMFAKPAPAPAPKKTPEPIVEKTPEPVKPEEPVEEVAVKEELPAPVSEPEPIETIETPPVETVSVDEPEVVITPSKDELTEDNLEQLPDTSQPAPTATAASTAASSWDPRSATGTPYTAATPQAARPPTSGFQASALKATGASVRTPSYNRRILDQEEAVRMPGNREVDRAAVQFGAFSLNGSGEEDVDGEREEAETRAQPPQHSPVAPRASLPPAPQQATPVSESIPTPKEAAGLPAATHPVAAPGLPSPAPLSSAQTTAQQAAPGASASQYGRYGPSGVQDSALPPKPYDAFNQQAPSTQSPFEGAYPSQQSQAQAQSQAGTFSSAPDQFSQYYTADNQQRNAYNSYYNQQYGMQQGAQSQDGPASQQRSFSGYNGPQTENQSQFSQSTAQQSQSRYATAGEGQNSGHTTPNPVAQSQQPGTSQTAPQPGHQQQPYPYGHPYYSSPYYAAYMNQQYQYGANYPGGPYGGKGGLHQQPYQGYGMSPAAPYDHAASPAAGGFGASSLHGRDSALGGLSDYGRAGSAQSSQTPQGLGGSGAFAGAHDAFGRNSSYQGQTQQHYNAQQGSQPGANDDLKPFGDAKTANGPSPSLSQAGRPGSATNTAPGSALPPPQSQQGGYGGYPAHLQQGHGLHGAQAGSQYGGLGAAGQGHQTAGQGHQNSQYGGYQSFGGGSYYGNNQQQRGGWGGNYGH